MSRGCAGTAPQLRPSRPATASADRMVTAGDFAYGIQRNLDPANASPYAYLLGFVLKGAN